MEVKTKDGLANFGGQPNDFDRSTMCENTYLDPESTAKDCIGNLYMYDDDSDEDGEDYIIDNNYNMVDNL